MTKMDEPSKRTLMFRFLDGVEWLGNKLPHPFWLFCILMLLVTALSDVMTRAGASAVRPETQVLRTLEQNKRIDGQWFQVDDGFDGLTVNLENASRSSRLDNVYAELHHAGQRVHEARIAASDLRRFRVDRARYPMLRAGNRYRLAIVNRAQTIKSRSLLSAAGLNWLVLNMVSNFSHFEPLGLVLVMLMGVAIAEGSGLIATVMRWLAMAVPRVLITPTLFALAACGNIGSDAGVVVIPPLAAAIYRQLGKNPIVGLLVGFVGATAGFTANLIPAGTDVLAMSLTNAATGNQPEINVFANWYFMAASVLFLSILGTLVTRAYVEPRLGAGAGSEQSGAGVEPLTIGEKRGILWAAVALALTAGVWMLTIVPDGGILRHPDPNPNMFWRSNFFRGLVPVLFTLFAVAGITYGYATATIKKLDDIIGFMTDAMKRMGGYIVLVLVIAQFTRMFQFARLDQLIAISGAHGLRALGFESIPVPFFVAFILIVAVANLFMGSASAKWAIFAPVFVPMFLSLGYHPAFTQLLYRLGDSITNCVSPLYPYFPLLLGWIADLDKSKAKVGTVLSYLTPYAVFLLVGWVIMLVGWYWIGLDIGPDSPIRMADSM